MSGLTLRVRAEDRPLGTDDEEGERLVELIRPRLARPGALAVALREGRAEWYDLGPVAAARLPIGGFLAALSRSRAGDHPPPLAVGLAGRFQLRRGGGVAPVGLVFLEWAADDRWWHWQRLLRDVRPGEDEDELESLTRAVDGDPMPDGLGRWFVRGRRTRATLNFGAERKPAVDGTQLVH